jgi:hypothetical protein
MALGGKLTAIDSTQTSKVMMTNIQPFLNTSVLSKEMGSDRKVNMDSIVIIFIGESLSNRHKYCVKTAPKTAWMQRPKSFAKIVEVAVVYVCDGVEELRMSSRLPSKKWKNRR